MYNAAGWLSKSTDALGTEVNYSYFSDGKLHQTMISAQPNTLITLSYNSRRQRSTLSDPNYGLMQTTYNAFGELISQTTPRGFETTYTYDLLGRTTRRVEDEGATTWHYSTTPGYLGTLERIEGLGQITSYTYDELLRPETVIENINKQDYTTAYTYDHFGRPETITHPSGFAEQNTYNNHGYLKKISNANDQSLLWEAQAYYAPGMLHQSATGNGLVTRNQYESETLRLTGAFVYNAAQERVQDFEYKYDKLGNMRHRIKWLNRDKNQFLKEEFWYDDLNRLTDIKLNGQPTGGHDYDPDGLGNIMAKTANGQQIYSNAEYGAGTHGPHAISSAITTANVFPADPQKAEYTSFEQLKSLSQGELGLSIMYGHHHQRIRQKYWDEETHFVSLKLWAGACEYITKNAQTTTLTYLSGPGGLYALHLNDPDESESIRYIHTDHLGSWTAISDETGTIINEQSYDAWGNRRNDSTWTNVGELQPPLFDRGFTGHEHLDGFQLINMNGRMYDPVVSRMLAPDNFVQTPDFSQNFNRYSYALNNPLKYTDPDGEFIIEAIMIGAFINTTMQLASGKVNSVGDFFLAAGIGAASGAAGAGAGALVGGALSTVTTTGGALLNGAAVGATGGFAGGFVGGVGNAWMGGSNLGQGIMSGLKAGGYGAAGGALLGGITGGFRFQKQMGIFRKGLDNLDVGANEPVIATDKLLNQAQKAWYPDAPMEHVPVFTVENVPQDQLIAMNKAGAAAKTAPISINEVLTGNSEMYFHHTNAFSSAKRLFFTMGHEFVHVSQIASLAGQSTSVLTAGLLEVMEYHAYSYEYTRLGSKNYGGFTPADVRSIATQYPNLDKPEPNRKNT